jgi:hypothetical protein
MKNNFISTQYIKRIRSQHIISHKTPLPAVFHIISSKHEDSPAGQVLHSFNTNIVTLKLNISASTVEVGDLKIITPDLKYDNHAHSANRLK